jgi:hypothetical protein
MQFSIPSSHDYPLATDSVTEPSLSPRAVTLVIGALVFATFGEGIILGLIPAAVPGIGLLFGTSAGDLTWVNTTQLHGPHAWNAHLPLLTASYPQWAFDLGYLSG